MLHLWLNGWAPSNAGWPPWSRAHDPETLGHLKALVRGIAAYRRHPYRRDVPDRPAAWTEGGIALRDYGGPGRPVLVVPSLVNRPDILDLMAGDGMLSALSGRGLRPLLLDWGAPGERADSLTLTDYVTGPLERAASVAARLGGGAVPVLGYCMGGTLSVALAQRRPDLVAGLILLATPWDFHAGPEAGRDAAGLRALRPFLAAAIAAEGALSADALNTVFALRDGPAIAAKFVAFGAAPQDSPRAEKFVAIEDWLADGVKLAPAVARACIEDWYGANAPGRGAWRVAGQVIDPASVGAPVLCVVPKRDRIVPEAAALAILRHLPRARVERPAAGHVGMIAGSGGPALWRCVHDWVVSLPAPGPSA